MLGYVVALLCVLSAAAFAAGYGAARHRVAIAIATAVLFVAGGLWLEPTPTRVGVIVILAAGVLLKWPRLGGLATGVAGLMAGLWGSILTTQGLPVVPAWLLAASLPSVTAFLSARHPGFAPTALREEALLMVGVLGLVVATGLAISAGWGSAAALNLNPAGGVREVAGVWVMVLSGVSVTFGGWHSLRRRR